MIRQGEELESRSEHEMPRMEPQSLSERHNHTILQLIDLHLIHRGGVDAGQTSASQQEELGAKPEIDRSSADKRMDLG